MLPTAGDHAGMRGTANAMPAPSLCHSPLRESASAANVPSSVRRTNWGQSPLFYQIFPHRRK